MTVDLRNFDTLQDLIRHVDTLIERYSKALSSLLRILEEYRVAAEQEKRLQQLIAKLAAGQQLRQGITVQLDENSYLMINPSAQDVVKQLEKNIEAINIKLSRLQQIRRKLAQVAEAGASFPVTVLIVDDIPVMVITSITTPLTRLGELQA